VLKGCYKGVTRVLQGCYKGVTLTLECALHVSEVVGEVRVEVGVVSVDEEDRDNHLG
jgi:hypothetical protein